MRGSGIIVLFVVIVAFVIWSSETKFINWSFVGLTPQSTDPLSLLQVTTQYVQSSDLPQITSTPTPFVQPSYTPYPTYTTLPTYTPVPTIVIERYITTPEDKRSDMIFMRFIFVFALLVAIVAAYLWYAQWSDDRRRNHEYEMKQLEIEHAIHVTERLRAESNLQASQPRPIVHNSRGASPTNTADTTHDTIEREPVVVTRQGYEIAKRRVIEFVTESLKPNGVGLVVSRWKTEQHWDQAIVEQVLDYLYDLDLITQRQNGRACSWLRDDIASTQVLRIIAQDQEQMMENEDV